MAWRSSEFVQAVRTQHARAWQLLGRSHLRRLLTAATAGLVAYGVLYAMHERFLAQLGLTAADIGLDRTRLLGGPVIGLLVLTALLTVVILIVLPLLSLTFLLAVNGIDRLARRRRWAAVFALTLLLAIIWAGSFLMVTRHRDLGFLIMVGTFATVGAISVIFDSVSRRAGPTSPMLTASDGRFVYGTILASLLMTSLALLVAGYAIADGAAANVKAGFRMTSRDIFGLPILTVEARAIQLVGRGPALDPTARRHPECLLYLGHNGPDTVLWDVRRQLPLQTEPAPGAIEVGSGHGEVPASCAPEPQRSGSDQALLDGGSARQVRVAGKGVGWVEERNHRWSTVTLEGVLMTPLEDASDPPLSWDLGPGSFAETSSAATLRCHATGCTARWWPDVLLGPHVLRLPPMTGCHADAIAVTERAVALALSGLSCHTRGIWRRQASAWRRLAHLDPAETVSSLDMSTVALAWSSQELGRWRIQWLRPGAPSPRTIMSDDSALEGVQALYSAVAVEGGSAVEWAGSWAQDSAFRENEIVEQRFDGGGCRALAYDVPGRDADGAGIDAAIDRHRVLFARESGLWERKARPATRRFSLGCAGGPAVTPVFPGDS